MKDGLCRGMAPNKRLDPQAKDLWFVERGESANPGRIICFQCPVRAECKDYAKRTESNEHGMWAGEING